MSRYKYLGPYDIIEIQGQRIERNDEFDATDDAFIEDQRRRGVHLFEPAATTSNVRNSDTHIAATDAQASVEQQPAHPGSGVA